MTQTEGSRKKNIHRCLNNEYHNTTVFLHKQHHQKHNYINKKSGKLKTRSTLYTEESSAEY